MIGTVGQGQWGRDSGAGQGQWGTVGLGQWGWDSGTDTLSVVKTTTSLLTERYAHSRTLISTDRQNKNV